MFQCIVLPTYQKHILGGLISLQASIFSSPEHEVLMVSYCGQ